MPWVMPENCSHEVFRKEPDGVPTCEDCGAKAEPFEGILTLAEPVTVSRAVITVPEHLSCPHGLDKDLDFCEPCFQQSTK